MTEQEINELIKNSGVDTNQISDGYHTFKELYDHRIELYITLCRLYLELIRKSGEGEADYYKPVWRSRFHSDETHWDGWFLLGIEQEKGKQITYHLPASEWENCSFAYTLDKAPEFDGHGSYDVINRLKSLYR